MTAEFVIAQLGAFVAVMPEGVEHPNLPKSLGARVFLRSSP